MTHALLTEIQKLSTEGGVVFWGLIGLAFVIAFTLLSILRFMSFPDPPLLSSREWLKLLGKKGGAEIRAHIERLDAILKRDPDSRAQELEGISQRLFSVVERRFPFAFTLIESAPLVGLLGTVTGMLSTFHGLSTGGEDTARVEMISQGIAEALISTQTGLIIGVPTFIVCSVLKSRFERQRLLFGQLESQLLQLASPDPA